MLYIPRRVRRISSNEQSDQNAICPLDELRDQAAWVLLGEPGAGKSLAFETEARATEGVYLSIAKFLSDEPDPLWQGKTLFLDGLDETRASGGDNSVLLRLRALLRKLGNPKFRIACRAADWFGATDSQAISDVSPNSQLGIFVLEPLNDTEIREILRLNHDIVDPQDFIEKARERGIDGLLSNPQTLRLLAESISDGQWPSSRQDTYLLACRKLAEEDSPLRRKQQRAQALPVEKILAAAGQLCAVMLLSDKTGLALDADSADAFFPLIDVFSTSDLTSARQAAGRKLFRPSDDGEERVVPSHRSIAEYLAARWLAEQIDQRGLPLRRVLNLFIGRDERTVAGLRGFYGWLALHCHAARQRLIEADPLTVVVYGDVKPMPAADKRKILAGLEREARQHLAFRWDIPSATPFGALAEHELVPEFSAALNSPERDDASQSFADCVLDILNEGEPIPELAPTIKSVVMDDSRWSGIRRHALRAWLTLSPPTEEAIALLDAINDRQVVDADDELAGELLNKLYPEHIAPENLFRYLHAPQKRNYIGGHSMFWGHELPRIAPESHLPILLDQLAARSDLAFSDEIEFCFDYRRMHGGLLSRGIEMYGDQITDERLFAWLGIGADKYGKCHRENEHQAVIDNWLGTRPERYKAVLALCYQQCEKSDRVRSCLYAEQNRLSGVKLPDDIGLWHLEQLPQTQHEQLAESHLWASVQALMYERGNAGLTLEMIEARVEANPGQQRWLETMLTCEIEDSQREEVALSNEYKLRRIEEKRKRSSELCKHLAAIGDGTATPGVMYELACVWDNRFRDARGETLEVRFGSYCENGEVVFTAAEKGFSLCPLRDDLPSVSEIIDLSTKRREHYLRKPCLIGMELRWRESASSIDALSDDCLRRMSAFRMTYGADKTPEWYVHLVRTRPALVAAVLIDYVGATLKARLDYVSETYPLVNDPKYREVAKLAVPELLKTFPVRAKSTQLDHLERLLKAALRYLPERLAGLLDQKLALKGMDVAQKVYWLTTAMLLKPPKFETVLWQYIGKNWNRANHLCDFLEERFNGISNDYALSPGSLGKLIELLSPHAEFGRRSGLITAAMRRGDLILGMVTRLGALATEESAQEIECLLASPLSSKLRYELEAARHQLRLRQREKAFRFPELSSVAQILANREPANSADLAALAVDCLDQIAVELRNDNDDGFRFFWNVEKKKPVGKREENLCRDALLTRLRLHLAPLGIDCQPEVDYANDKRADIRLSVRNEYEFPIEIKRDDNSSLWTALRNQLMAQYTKANGFGLYLVLWFGKNDLPRVTDGGKKPTSPENLQARLEAQLDPEERTRVFVRVLDVSWPERS